MVLLYLNADLTLFAQKEWKLLELNSALCVGFAPGVVLCTIPQTLSCSSPEEGSWETCDSLSPAFAPPRREEQMESMYLLSGQPRLRYLSLTVRSYQG